MAQIFDGKVLGVIPARYDSKRFPGKVLALLGGLPMAARVYLNAKKSSLLDDLVVATDSPIVEKELKSLNIPVTLTSPSHRSGTERVAEVARLYSGVKVVGNIQGDDPGIDPGLIDLAVSAVKESPGTQMATAATRRFTEADWKDPNVVKVRVDHRGFATDFFRTAPGEDFPKGCFKHVGLYVYEKEFLLDLVRMDPGSRETERDLEQMRALDAGASIKVVLTDTESLGVNTLEDLERVREAMRIA